MLISSKGRYALRLMIYIAALGDAEGKIALREVADREHISQKYLEQLVRPLMKAGLLKSVRGKGGGYMMAKDPAEVRAGDILRAVEGSTAPVACDGIDNSCTRSDLCSTVKFWRGLDDVIEKYVDGVTLADLAAVPEINFDIKLLGLAFVKSYEAFDSRLALLETARFQDFDNDYVVSGCAYIYEQVFGLSITLFKRLLEYEGATLAASGSPRAILKESYRFYDFIDEAAWLDMLRDRNTNVHIYDNKLAQDLIQRILNVYIPAFCQLRDGLMERYGELLMAPDDQFV